MQKLLSPIGGVLSEIFQPVNLKNLIFNGNFDIWQRGTSFTAINGYSADRFGHYKAGSMAVDGSQQTDVPSSSPVYSAFSLRHRVSTAQATLATGDISYIRYCIEGYHLRLLYNNPFTLTFWVKATVIGTYCVAFKNSANNYCYIDEFVVNASSTWEKKTIVVPAWPGGTWDYTSGIGLKINWVLASGASFQTTAKSWQTGNFYATSKQVNAVAAANNDFLLSQVQLEPGVISTEFENRSYDEELRFCHRYYSRFQLAAGGYGLAGNILYFPFFLPRSMRALPSYSLVGTASRGNLSTVAVNGLTQSQCLAALTVTAAGIGQVNELWEANAEL